MWNNLFWRIFSAFYLAFFLAIELNPQLIPLLGAWEWLDFGISLIAIFGLICYAFGLKILAKVFWRYFLVSFILFEVIYMLWLQQPFLERANVKEFGCLNSLLNILWQLPVVYAMFRLQQRQDALRNETTTDTEEQNNLHDNG